MLCWPWQLLTAYSADFRPIKMNEGLLDALWKTVWSPILWRYEDSPRFQVFDGLFAFDVMSRNVKSFQTRLHLIVLVFWTYLFSFYRLVVRRRTRNGQRRRLTRGCDVIFVHCSVESVTLVFSYVWSCLSVCLLHCMTSCLDGWMAEQKRLSIFPGT